MTAGISVPTLAEQQPSEQLAQAQALQAELEAERAALQIQLQAHEQQIEALRAELGLSQTEIVKLYGEMKSLNKEDSQLRRQASSE
ncbi:MAG: hypothetical protein AB8B86_18060 [Pseudomonadales bacterium]